MLVRLRSAAVALASASLLAGCSIATGLLAKGGAKSTSPTSGAGMSATSGPVLDKQADDGMTSATHARYVGQIVFASQQIDAKAPDESQLFSEFHADELLYGRAYLPHSLVNEPVFADGSDKPSRNVDGSYVIKIVVDGRAITNLLERGETRMDKRKRTTQQVWPRPAPSDEPTSTTWVDLVNGLSPGRHEIQIELWPETGSFKARAPIAKGTLTLHKAANARIGVGKTASDLKAGMTDPALSSELMVAIRAYAKKEGWKESIPDLTIESREWGDVVREHTRYVVARRVVTWVHLDGGAQSGCGAQRIVFEQQIKAQRPTGAIYVKDVGPRTTLDCSVQGGSTADRWAGRDRARPTPTATATASPRTPTAVAQTGSKLAPKPEPRSAAIAGPKPAPTPDPVTTNEPTRPAAAPAQAPPRDVATSESAALTTTEATPSNPRSLSPGRVSIGLGMAANALDASGVATYGNLGLHLGRVELGAGATWPLNALGYVRVNLLSGRLELSPMITATALAEMDVDTSFALAGGMSLAYPLVISNAVSAGLRLDVLVSYNPDPGELALPVLGSTYVRF